MIFLPKLGNIKVGGVEKGTPVKYNKIHITTTSKEGEENFQLHPSFKEPVKSLKILLPFVFDIEKNFIYDKISFVIVNGKYRFYAKNINDIIYLFPYQMDVIPNVKGGQLPVVKLGSAEEWEENLDMEYKGLLYAYIIDPEKNNPLELVDDTIGVFFYKTSNPYSVDEIVNTLNLLKSMYKNKNLGKSNKKIAKQLRFAPLKMEMHTKLVDINKGKEETYLRILPPSMKDILKSIKISEEYPEIFEYLNNIEQIFIEERSKEIENAISLAEFKLLLGENVHIVTEKIFDSLVKNKNYNPNNKNNIIGINANQKEEADQKRAELEKKAMKFYKKMNLSQYGMKEKTTVMLFSKFKTEKAVKEFLDKLLEKYDNLKDATIILNEIKAMELDQTSSS